MNATITPLFPITPVTHFLRLGHTGHRQLETLHEAGRFPAKRVIVDAAHAFEQKELIDTLRASGIEIVLDTRMAELATPGGYQTSAGKLPWAHSDRPYSLSDFTPAKLKEVAKKIAEFAVLYKVDTILGPTRLIEGPQDPWMQVDLASIDQINNALARASGDRIRVDYSLMTTYQILLDGSARRGMILNLANAECDYLWTRIANFGGDKSPAGIRKYINALRDFHSLDIPIIADGVGGLAGLAILAFGAAGGIAHGVAEKERFYPTTWWKPRNSGSGGGTKRRVYFEGLDAYLNEEQAALVLATRNAKPLLGCRDTGCCPGGWQDMIANPKAHYLTQTFRRIRELSNVPELRRADHYLSQQLAAVDRIARKSLQLKIGDEKIEEKLRKNNKRTDDMRRVFEELHETDQNPSRSPAAAVRVEKATKEGRGR